jgi:hypothetical protein
MILTLLLATLFIGVYIAKAVAQTLVVQAVLA